MQNSAHFARANFDNSVSSTAPFVIKNDSISIKHEDHHHRIQLQMEEENAIMRNMAYQDMNLKASMEIQRLA